MTTTQNVLSSRAMLAGVKISLWGARKHDRKISDEVNTSHGAAADSGRYNKALLAKEALAKITAISTEARQLHALRTLPWLDEGARILPALAFLDYSAKMRAIKEAFDGAVADFVAAYPQYVEDARKRLNGLWAAADYPDPREIADKFGMKVRIMPMPDAKDFRVDMGDAQAAGIREEIEAAMKEALIMATRDAWERVADVVAKMVDRLTAYKPAERKGVNAIGVFRDSLVGNVRDLVEILPSLNLTNDSRLEAITERMQHELCVWDAEDLRENDNARSATAKAAKAILDEVSEFLA